MDWPLVAFAMFLLLLIVGWSVALTLWAVAFRRGWRPWKR